MLELMRQAARSTMAMPFRAVDVAKQAEAYRIEARGAEDGAANGPEPSSGTLALSEQEIVTAIGAERDRCLIDLTSHLRCRTGRPRADAIRAMDIAGMQQAAGEAISDFETINASHAGAIERGQRRPSALLDRQGVPAADTYFARGSPADQPDAQRDYHGVPYRG